MKSRLWRLEDEYTAARAMFLFWHRTMEHTAHKTAAKAKRDEARERLIRVAEKLDELTSIDIIA